MDSAGTTTKATSVKVAISRRRDEEAPTGPVMGYILGLAGETGEEVYGR
jgi:hypothetical protein